MTATEMLRARDFRDNLRRRRAEVVAHAVLTALRPLLNPDRLGDAYHVTMKALTDRGVELLCDYDREQMGLPPRDEMGWTEAELRAHDALLLQAMMRPIFTVTPDLPVPPKT